MMMVTVYRPARRLIGPISLMAAFILTMILISLPRQPLSPDHRDLPFGDHPSADFGNEIGHHHHQHPHDPDHDVRTSRQQVTPGLPTDWMHVWRIVILILNSFSLIIALVAIYIKFVNENRPRARISTLISSTKILKME